MPRLPFYTRQMLLLQGRSQNFWGYKKSFWLKTLTTFKVWLTANAPLSPPPLATRRATKLL